MPDGKAVVVVVVFVAVMLAGLLGVSLVALLVSL
jgi:hypothetical protein